MQNTLKKLTVKWTYVYWVLLFSRPPFRNEKCILVENIVSLVGSPDLSLLPAGFGSGPQEEEDWLLAAITSGALISDNNEKLAFLWFETQFVEFSCYLGAVSWNAFIQSLNFQSGSVQVWLEIISLFYYFCNSRIPQGVFLNLYGSAVDTMFISCLEEGRGEDIWSPSGMLLFAYWLFVFSLEPYH